MNIAKISLGGDWKMRQCADGAEYDVFSHAGAFPPTYFAVGRHNLLIDRKPLHAFSKQLLQHGIPSRADVFLHAPHGFGEGTGSGAEGWIELAHAFMRTL